MKRGRPPDGEPPRETLRYVAFFATRAVLDKIDRYVAAAEVDGVKQAKSEGIRRAILAAPDVPPMPVTDDVSRKPKKNPKRI